MTKYFILAFHFIIFDQGLKIRLSQIKNNFNLLFFQEKALGLNFIQGYSFIKIHHFKYYFN